MDARASQRPVHWQHRLAGPFAQVARLAPILLTLWVGVAAFAAFPPGWLPPTTLSLGGSGAQPSDVALCTRDAAVFAVWSDARLGDRHLFFRRSDDFGAIWSDEALIPTPAGDATEPALACDDSALYLVWTQTLGATTGDILFSRFDGTTWETPTAITRDGRARRPKIGVTKAFPHSIGLVFERIDQDGTRAMYAESRDGGSQWSAPVPLASTDAATSQPNIAGGAERFFLVWRDEREGTSHIFFTTRGIGFIGPERPLSQVGGNRFPAIAVEGNRVLVAWESRPDGALPDIVATLSDDEGTRWEVPVVLAETIPQSTRPAVLLLDDMAYAYWQEGGRSGWQVHGSRRDLLGTWNPPRLLTEPTADSLRPQVAAAFPPSVARTDAAAQIQLVWIDRDPTGETVIRHATRDTIPPEPPTRPVLYDLSAPTGWDDDGTLLFTWDPVATAHVYRVFAAWNGAAFQEVGTTEQPEFRLDADDGATVRVYVVAEDDVGNQSLPSPASAIIRVDRTVPSASIHEPLSGSVLFSPTPIRISCRDENLKYWVLEYGETPSPTVWTPLSEPATEPVHDAIVAEFPIEGLDGVYTLRLRAEDFAGHEAIQSMTLRVDTAPPLPVVFGETWPLLPPNPDATARRHPRWGGRLLPIAFVSDEEGTQDIWITGIDGTGARPLTVDPYLDAAPSWSPDGERVVYASLRNGSWDIFLADVNGTGPIPLIASPFDEVDPVWSPDGGAIAFATRRDGDFEIVVLENVAGVLSGDPPVLTQLTRNNIDDREPDWSPDGRAIAYAARRGAVWDIWEQRLATDEAIPLVQSPHTDRKPRYGPTGKQLLFTRSLVDGTAELHVFDRVRGEARRISPDGTNAGTGDWSPDGRFVVFESDGDLRIASLAFPAPRLEARIVAPANGEFVSPTVLVRGVARGEEMDFYELDYARAETPTAFTSITGRVTAPVREEGFLGQWDTRGLQGDFILRLRVVGQDGSEETVDVTVHARESRPQLEVDAPNDGLETLDARLRIAGFAEPGATLALNDERIPTDPDGRFESIWPLEPGENALRFRVTDALGGETTIVRRVMRVVAPFRVEIGSPGPFQIVQEPYVEVRGRAPEAVRVRIDGVDVPIGSDGEFARVLAIEGERRDIAIDAEDRLGRTATVRRVVFYDSGTGDGADTVPPALVEPNPPFGAIIRAPRLRFEARLVDDRAVDPDTLLLNFDGTDLDPERWTFDEATGVLRYEPELELADGSHVLRVDGKDIAGNPLRFGEWGVRVDTEPLILSLSALPVRFETRDRTVTLRVLLTANRPLRAVVAAQLRGPDQPIGFPLRLTGASSEPPYSYETTYTVAADRPIALSAEVLTDEGVRIPVRGVFALITLNRQRRTVVTQSNGVSIRFPPDPSGQPRRAIFRTYDGSTLNRTRAQRQDLAVRNLGADTPDTGIYVVEPVDPNDTLPPFDLVVPETGGTPRAWFRWDEAGQRWVPLAEQRRTEAVRIAANLDAGIYALLADTDPPVLADVVPKERSAIPMERYVVEARFTDVGSGVDASSVVARLDGVPARVEVQSDGQEALVRYVPTDLAPGLHTLELLVADRAGNMATEAFDYLTSDVFAFTSVWLYPNPIRDGVGIVAFRLTRTANVTLRIFTPNGEVVHTDALRGVVGDGGTRSGRETFRWDLTNAAGRPVASGVYLIVLEARLPDGRTIRHFDKWAVIR